MLATMKRLPNIAIFSRTRIGAIAVTIVLALAAVPSTAAPDRMSGGGKLLPRVAEATRSVPFVELYRVSFYLPRYGMTLAEVRDPSVTKVFYIEVLYTGRFPDRVPPSWGRELLPKLPGIGASELAQTFYNLRVRDEIIVTYTPKSGSDVVVNGGTRYVDPGTAFIDGLIDKFLGPNPVSEDLKKTLSAPLAQP